MTKKEQKELAKEIMQEAIGCAYYKISDNPKEYGLSEGEEEKVIEYINKYGKAACKAIGKEYVTY